MASPIEHMSDVVKFASFYQQLAFEMASTSHHRPLHAREMDLIIENAMKDDSEIAAACHRRLDLPISYFTDAWRQLVLMTKAWQGVLSAKLRYERVGHCDVGREFMEAVLLCEFMIPERARIGFPDAGPPIAASASDFDPPFSQAGTKVTRGDWFADSPMLIKDEPSSSHLLDAIPYSHGSAEPEALALSPADLANPATEITSGSETDSLSDYDDCSDCSNCTAGLLPGPELGPDFYPDADTLATDGPKKWSTETSLSEKNRDYYWAKVMDDGGWDDHRTAGPSDLLTIRPSTQQLDGEAEPHPATGRKRKYADDLTAAPGSRATESAPRMLKRGWRN